MLMICWIVKQIYWIEQAEIFRISICRSSLTCNTFLCQLHKLKYVLLNRKNTHAFCCKFVCAILQWNLFIKFIEVCLPENLQTQRTIYEFVGSPSQKLTLSELSLSLCYNNIAYRIRVMSFYFAKVFENCLRNKLSHLFDKIFVGAIK